MASGVSTENRTQAQIDASLNQTTTGIVTAPLLVPATGAALAYGGAVFYGMGMTAQTVPLSGGIAAVSAGKWVATTGVGFAMGAGLEYGINSDASPSSMIVGGIGGAIGGTTKLGLNAAFGLPNQWMPSTLANLGTWIAGSQVAGRATKGTLNQVVDTEANRSWWTTPVSICGLLPRKPC
jgi:filamentous hemagglutinin